MHRYASQINDNVLVVETEGIMKHLEKLKRCVSKNVKWIPKSSKLYSDEPLQDTHVQI